MHTWGRRIRGGVRMGLIWAVAWSLAGGVLARLPGFDTDLPLPLLFLPLGFVTGLVFSGVLVAAAGRRRFESLSMPRFSGWGALSGLALSAIIVAGAAYRGDNVVSEILLFTPPLTIAGAVCAAGSLALARRAERRELSAANGLDAISPLSASEERELLGRGE